MFSLHDLCFVLCSLDLDELRAQRIMDFWLNYPQINGVGRSEHLEALGLISRLNLLTNERKYLINNCRASSNYNLVKWLFPEKNLRRFHAETQISLRGLWTPSSDEDSLLDSEDVYRSGSRNVSHQHWTVFLKTALNKQLILSPGFKPFTILLV